jgi:hypothetical protein
VVCTGDLESSVSLLKVPNEPKDYLYLFKYFMSSLARNIPQNTIQLNNHSGQRSVHGFQTVSMSHVSNVSNFNDEFQKEF